MTQRTPKKSKLERDLEGKPKIILKEFEKIAVHMPTQEEYNTLMQVLECGGQRWLGGDLPTQNDYWNTYREETCIDAENKFQFCDKKFYHRKKYKVISTQKFYNEQSITLENIDEINKWFEENA